MSEAGEPADLPFRVLPDLEDRAREFWTGGEHGELRFLRCADCGTYVHPPTPMCPEDHGKNLRWEAVSGQATVVTFTINHQPWMPGPPLPWIIAIVEIAEDPKVRLTTNLVGVAPEDVRIGMPVRVRFEHQPSEAGDVWIPLFEPDGAVPSQGG